jgi:hypothetical protein
MADTRRDPDQLEAALDEVFQLLCFSVENPGTITVEELGSWLRAAAAERERQGDFGATQILDEMAMATEDSEQETA